MFPYISSKIYSSIIFRLKNKDFFSSFVMQSVRYLLSVSFLHADFVLFKSD